MKDINWQSLQINQFAVLTYNVHFVSWPSLEVKALHSASALVANDSHTQQNTLQHNRQSHDTQQHGIKRINSH